MDSFLRWLASWRGIELEPGADLQFEFANFPSGGLGMLVLMGCAAAVMIVAFLYRRDGKNLTLPQRVVLGTLRSSAVLAAIALLLEPNLVTVKRETRPGHTILLVDTSQSMTHTDAWRRDSVQAQAGGWRAFGIGDPAAVTRLDLVKALLAHGEGELVRKLAAKNQVQLYGFSGSLDQLPVLPPPEPRRGPDGQPLPVDPMAPVPPPRLDLTKLVADGRSTNLGGALRTALDRSRTAEIAAVVFVSDGRRNAGPQAAEIARVLNQRKIPHTFVLGVGDPSETQTMTLTRFETPAKVFQRDPFEMKATVVSEGYEPTVVKARLVRIDDKGVEQPLPAQQVEIGGTRTEVQVEWKELTADAPGRFLYRAEIQPPDGEPIVAERHSKVAAVEVLDERLRLLLISGGASHEFQILRNLLIRDKTIDVACWLQSADPKFPQDGNENVRIDRLPEERADFDPYDVVVMIDPDYEKLTPHFCEMLQQHIVEDGCGFWWVCGEKYSLDAMRPTAPTRPLAELLPIVPDIEYAERKIIGFGVAFKWPNPYVLSPEGMEGIGAKLTQIGETKDSSRLLWSRLPGFHFWFPVLRLKPVAVALAEHPNPEFRRGGHGMPMIAVQNVGAGRVMFTGTDETYRWRSLYEEAYNRFWVNGIRYLFEGRLQAGNSRLRLSASDDKIDLGEAIELVAEVKDEALQPLVAESFAVAIERESEPAETVHLMPVVEAPGTYSLRFRPTQLGSYRARPLQKIGKNVEVSFQVVAAQIERHGPMDRGELQAIAGANGGEVFDTPQALLAALDRIPSRSATDTFRTPHAVWDGWPTIVFLLVVLSLEWLLRKRFNLL
ncbi:MAG TPA: vWA domain-containing protein [Planctomycetota bacterium]|nr:vWA domain-containing protein [Planctomycetota bacterium]